MAISHDPSAPPADPPRGLAARWAMLSAGAKRRRAAGLGIALAIEALLLLLLLTLGAQMAGREDGKEKVTTFTAIEFAAPPPPAPEPPAETSPDSADTPPVPQPAPEAMPSSPLARTTQPAAQPQPPSPAQPPADPPPQPKPQPQPQPPAKPKSTIGAKVDPSRRYGPVDGGNPRMAGDSERVGSMPNGEPLYAARWYREPTEQELSGYLSTANGPGYALIACKVVSGYHVEDCQFLGESPQGSQIGRAVMAAAWQFRVRPARIGGREQFGTWVRIRISYTEGKRAR